jgi:hypothetical protein
MSIVTTFISELGSWTLTVADGGTATTCKALSIGKIKYDFDMVGDGQTLNYKAMVYNAIDFELYNLDDAGNNLYNRLFTNLLSTDAVVTLAGSIYRTGETWQFKFLLSQAGLEVDSVTKKLKCKCTPFLDNTITVKDVFDDVFAVDGFSADVSGLPFDAVSVGSWLVRALELINTGLTDTVINLADSGDLAYTSKFYLAGDDAIYNGKIGLAILDLGIGDLALLNSINFIAGLALAEGAFFGTGFDANFYTNRLNVGTAINIDFNNVLELKIIPRLPVFKSIELTLGGSANLVTYTATETYSNPNLIKILAIDSNTGVIYKGTDVGAGFVTAYTGSGSVDIEQPLMESGLSAIKESFPANVTQVIEFKLRDCSLLKAYNSFTFTNGFDEVDGRTYRLSYAEYDIIKNDVSCKAYEI